MEFREANEIGRKTFFWYRVYCASLAALYLVVAVIGAVLATDQFDFPARDREQMLIIGIAYVILGAMAFIVFSVALFLPPKPYNWIVGIIVICIGLSSCCLWPAVIPLLIYWVKPETQAFLGRKQPS